MIIGVISDTHDRIDTLKEAISIFKAEKVEVIVHCGDWVSPFVQKFLFNELGDYVVPIKSIFGNNIGDIKRSLEENFGRQNPIEFSTKEVLEVNFDTKKGIICHGNDKAVLNAIINSQQYDVIFTGHTHKFRNEMVGRTLVLNPGSTGHEYESNIVEESSIAIYNSDTNSAQQITF